MTKWKPIETAPKDGTDILVWHPEHREMFVCFWNGDDWQFATTPEGDAVVLDGGETQWHPLPDQPLDTDR